MGTIASRTKLLLQLILPLLMLLPFISMASEQREPRCLKPGKIREIYEGQTRVHEKAFCTRTPLYEVMSASCLSKKSCEAIKKYTGSSHAPTDFSPVGSPSHRKCLRLKGKPSLIEYFDGSQWKPVGLCTFADGSFISVDNLL